MAKAKGKSKKGKKGKAEELVVGQLNFAKGSYLESTSRPLYGLLFLIPLIVLYELGTLLVNTDQIAHTQARVAAFSWLLGLMEWIGVPRSVAWALPGLLVVVILMCWHLCSHYSWSVNIGWLGWMGVECVLLTVPLYVMAAISSDTFVGGAAGVNVSSGGEPAGYLAEVVTSVGAGIYEELMFRLIVFGLLLMLFEDVLKMKDTPALLGAVLISALLFSAHHYVGWRAGGICMLEEFTFGSFIYRAAAGVYFAILIRYRGFGITAGTHGAYDIIYFTFT